MSPRPETAFLPAALEIQETPPSPAARAIVSVILLFFVFSLSWAALSEVDIVSVAHGRIIPSGHSKTVQPLEIGTVKAIHVGEGQAVKTGEVLIELDPSAALADVVSLRSQLAMADLEIERSRQLVAWSRQEDVESIGEQHPAALDRLLIGQWREFQDRVDVLHHEQDRKRAEQEKVQQQVEKHEAVLPIIFRQARDRKGLAEKKLLPEQHYLETERQRLELVHDLRSHQGHVAELEAGIRELDARIEWARSEFHRQVLERLDEAGRRRTAVEQELIKADTRAMSHMIRAPVDGVVQQLAIHNVGAIVTPAQQLMVIVPQGGLLEVEAMLENRDIGFVEVGQQAEIKVDTFPFTRYGTVAGEVADLSNDAVLDEHKGLVYRMRVLMERSEIRVNGRQVTLSPGMTVTVESRTGTRKMIEFFLSPLLRYADESVRER